MSEPTFNCPRRWSEDKLLHDSYARRVNKDFGQCSYCGSMHPDDFIAAVKAGKRMIPTDKPYKVYISQPDTMQDKFYFDHLDDAQRAEFIALLNANKINFGYPGHFYVLPYFLRVAKTPE